MMLAFNQMPLSGLHSVHILKPMAIKPSKVYARCQPRNGAPLHNFSEPVLWQADRTSHHIAPDLL
eukprot:7511113-Pyramimonas_sp.AAC.1